MVCDGYCEYGGQKCTFCTNGGFQLSGHDSYLRMTELAEEYKEFIDNGGKAEDWRG